MGADPSHPPPSLPPPLPLPGDGAVLQAAGEGALLPPPLSPPLQQILRQGLREAPRPSRRSAPAAAEAVYFLPPMLLQPPLPMPLSHLPQDRGGLAVLTRPGRSPARRAAPACEGELVRDEEGVGWAGCSTLPPHTCPHFSPHIPPSTHTLSAGPPPAARCPGLTAAAPPPAAWPSSFQVALACCLPQVSQMLPLGWPGTRQAWPQATRHTVRGGGGNKGGISGWIIAN